MLCGVKSRVNPHESLRNQQVSLADHVVCENSFSGEQNPPNYSVCGMWYNEINNLQMAWCVVRMRQSATCDNMPHYIMLTIGYIMV